MLKTHSLPTGNAGVGTASPTNSLTFASGCTREVYCNTADQTTNYERAWFAWSGNIFNIVAEQGRTGIIRDVRIGGNSSYVYIGKSSGTTAAFEVRGDGKMVLLLRLQLLKQEQETITPIHISVRIRQRYRGFILN